MREQRQSEDAWRLALSKLSSFGRSIGFPAYDHSDMGCTIEELRQLGPRGWEEDGTFGSTCFRESATKGSVHLYEPCSTLAERVSTLAHELGHAVQFRNLFAENLALYLQKVGLAGKQGTNLPGPTCKPWRLTIEQHAWEEGARLLRHLNIPQPACYQPMYEFAMDTYCHHFSTTINDRDVLQVVAAFDRGDWRCRPNVVLVDNYRPAPPQHTLDSVSSSELTQYRAELMREMRPLSERLSTLYREELRLVCVAPTIASMVKVNAHMYEMMAKRQDRDPHFAELRDKAEQLRVRAVNLAKTPDPADYLRRRDSLMAEKHTVTRSLEAIQAELRVVDIQLSTLEHQRNVGRNLAR